MKQDVPQATVSLTGRRKADHEEYLVRYEHTLPACAVWLPIGFTAELLEDIIRDTRGD